MTEEWLDFIIKCRSGEKHEYDIVIGAKIEQGNYDIESTCNYRVPTYWEIGRVYKRLIKMVDDNTEKYVETAVVVLTSWIIEKIDNYNSSMYYENPDYIYQCYKEGKVL